MRHFCSRIGSCLFLDNIAEMTDLDENEIFILK